MHTRWKSLLSGLACGLSATSAAWAGPTLEAIKRDDVVRCGVSQGIVGFSAQDEQGEWQGLDIDLCRALAAAVLGNANKIEVTPLNTQQRFTALQANGVDILTRNTTLTLTRDASLGLTGVGVNFYDGQGVMVARDRGITQAVALDGATICVQPGTTSEMNLADWFRGRNLTFQPLVIEDYDEIVQAFAEGRCTAFTTDKSQLAATRASEFPVPDNYVILPEDFSKEPLGPIVRQGDVEWFNVVRWTLNAMLEAEEYGVTAENVDVMLQSAAPNVQRLLGVTSGTAEHLGLDDQWAYHVIQQVGNYGESFERHVGVNSPLGLERGLNAQWRDGGLMYGWPVR